MSDLAGRDYWDNREGVVRRRLPSKLNVTVGDMTALLARHVRPGHRVLEVGCAPGKYLLWCARTAGAHVSGVEYAPASYEHTARLFHQTGTLVDLRMEDFVATTFQPGSFDLVYSLGVIEHFTGDALLMMVRKHVELLKPGGTALIAVPNYAGPYGRLQAWLDPCNLAIHNVEIMCIDALAALAPFDLASVRAVFTYGRLTPWLLSLDAKMPRAAARLLAIALNAVGLVQPLKIEALAPWLVLELARTHD
jgi:2-polyprenyl-3-methyl-5-hydroxy-6-metoxy-1,4-benzoquinol methylase